MSNTYKDTPQHLKRQLFSKTLCTARRGRENTERMTWSLYNKVPLYQQHDTTTNNVQYNRSSSLFLQPHIKCIRRIYIHMFVLGVKRLLQITVSVCAPVRYDNYVASLVNYTPRSACFFKDNESSLYPANSLTPLHHYTLIFPSQEHPSRHTVVSHSVLWNCFPSKQKCSERSMEVYLPACHLRLKL